MIYLKNNNPAVGDHGKTLIGFNVINGKDVEGDLPSFESRSAIDSRDMVGIFPECGEKDIERAVKAAHEAFKSWKDVPAPQRGAIVGKIGDVMEAHKEKLARIITREIGKTHREAVGEVQEAIDTCRFFQSEGFRLYGQTFPSELRHKELSTYRRPVGVCGILTASNFPLAVPAWKVIPAILCGNTVVWKPSNDSPSVAYLFAKAMMDAGLPPGVVNIVNGKGRGGCGKHFIAGIDKGYYQRFSFTGSTAMGRVIGEMCGRNLIIPSLELGGKNPMVVMEDANIDNAVQSALWAAFGTAGQRCTSLANIILHQPIAKRFKEKFMDALAKMEIGNPLQHPDVMYGPLICKRIHDGFMEHFEQAKGDVEKGAKLLSGGARWTEENRNAHVKGDIANGYYMQPAVWDDVTPDMWLFQNEVFGPTVNFSTVKDFDEAMTYANGTPYGLSSAIYTEKRPWIERFKTESNAGMSSINNSTTGAEAHTPFGGNGWSGNGTRENGIWVLDGYTKWQTVNDDCSGKLQVAQIDAEHGKKTKHRHTNWEAL